MNNWGLLAFCGGAFILYQVIPLPFLGTSSILLGTGITLAALGGVVLPFFILTRKLGIPFRIQFQLERTKLTPTLAVIGATLSLVPALEIITWHMSQIYPPDPRYMELLKLYRGGGPLSLAMIGIALVLAGPLAEEVLFRGVVQRLLLRQNKPFLAIILTAGLFGMSHPLYSMPGAVILGLFFGILAYMLGNLYYPLIAHCVWNLLNLLILKISPDSLQVATPFTDQPVVWIVISLSLFAFFSRFWLQARQ
ncbi:MAG: CPBP family intramembrane metalloprotease [bacterium]|nr:CPBP family intramembrane metalloprotease [bacterium]